MNAMANCKASVMAVDVNDGSFDSNDAALTFALSETSPFNLGDTMVKLIVTNSAGATSSCDARIRVVDKAGPSIDCHSLGTSAPFTSERTFTATASDNCPGAVQVTVTGDNCYRIAGGGTRAYKSPTCKVTLNGPSITIGTKCTDGDHVEWSVEAVDAAGNVATKTCALIFQGVRNLKDLQRHYLRSLA
jgi:hypothetical protein